jgi:hypothetical protein
VSCVLVVLTTSCSSPSAAPPDPAPTVDERAVAEGLAALYAGDGPDREDVREGDCFAEELLGSTEPEELRAGGLLDASYAVPEELPALDPGLAGPVADAQLACTDFIADSTAAQVSITKGRLDADAYAACLRGALDQEAVRAGVIASLLGDFGDPAVQALSDAQAGCADQ